MKKTALGLLLILASFYLFSATSVHAAQVIRNEIRNNIREDAGEGAGDDLSVSVTPAQVRKEIREETRNENEQENQVGPYDIIGRIRNFIKKNFEFGARIEGTILSVGTDSLSVKGNDGKTYQINVLSTTNLVRAFGGKSSLAEFSVGDKVMIFGKFTDSTDTAINANTIRDLSIQKRWGVFFGQITALNSNNFVMQTVERGVQTVYFGTSKFVNRKEAAINYADLKVGDRVRVKGVWDKTLNQISEVSQIKDFSLPVIAPTSVPSPTPTP